MKFINNEHRKFFEECTEKCRVNDCYHQAFFYIMGVARDTRTHINSVFDFKTDCIKPKGLNEGWQTGSTAKACRLAFNLWNGYTEEGKEADYTPENLFCSEFAPYFMEGIRLRYPEYCSYLILS